MTFVVCLRRKQKRGRIGGRGGRGKKEKEDFSQLSWEEWNYPLRKSLFMRRILRSVRRLIIKRLWLADAVLPSARKVFLYSLPHQIPLSIRKLMAAESFCWMKSVAANKGKGDGNFSPSSTRSKAYPTADISPRPSLLTSSWDVVINTCLLLMVRVSERREARTKTGILSI